MGYPGRRGRILGRGRDPHWGRPPFHIEMSECVNCRTCLRSCPPGLAAVFERGLSVFIVPELCSGCGRCVAACPVGAIHDDEGWTPTREDRWEEPMRTVQSAGERP